MCSVDHFVYYFGNSEYTAARRGKMPIYILNRSTYVIFNISADTVSAK